jgi:hypothetical protein
MLGNIALTLFPTISSKFTTLEIEGKLKKGIYNVQIKINDTAVWRKLTIM